MGGGSRPPKISSFCSCFLAGFPGNSLHIYLYGVISFQNYTEGESAIWQQKVIWQFIFRAALLPAACFKLSLWHKGIHHFNCMLLFSQTQICFIFFFLSPVVFFLSFLSFFFFFFLFLSPILKSQKYLLKPSSFYSQGVFNTEIFHIAYLVLNHFVAEMLGWSFSFLFK